MSRSSRTLAAFFRMRAALPPQLGPALLLLTFACSRPLLQAAQFPEPELQQAALLIEQGNLRGAEEKIQQALRTNPNSVVAHRMLATVYLREEKFPRAEEELEKALQFSQQKDPKILFALCQAKFALKKTGEALDLAAQVAELEPNDAGAHYAVGRLLRENSFAEEGAKELERARSLDAQNPAVTTELILAYSQSGHKAQAEELFAPLLNRDSASDLIQAGSRFGEAGQYAAAIRAFERATELQPDSYDGQFDLAFAYFNQKEFAKAGAALDRIRPSSVESHPDFHYLRGRIELALDHAQAAGEEFLRALEPQPDNESLCMDTGLLFFRHENFWKALEVFESCSRRLVESAPVMTGLALSYFRLGKYDDAIGTFRKVLALKPEADAAREGLAFLLYVSGRAAESRQVLAERLDGADVDYYLYYLNALVLVRLDPQRNRALESLDETLRRNPKFAPAYFQRGKIRAEQGDAERALADLETSVRLDASYAPPYYLMGQIYFKLGKKEEAEQARERFNQLTHEQEEKEQKRQVENQLFQSLQ